MASREAGTGAPEEAETVVLVVDDEPDVASVTATYLDRHLDDVAVVVESSGGEAIRRLNGDVDCVVSDYEMPEVDGLELLRRIRQSTPDLPFILFTARGSEEIASEAISAGVTDYLQKGIGTDQYAVLANRIGNAIARRQSEAAAAETEMRYRRLLESSPHAIAVHDTTDVLFANDRLREIIGAPSIDAVKQYGPAEFVHEADRERVIDRMGRIVQGEAIDEWSEWRLERVDGEIRHVESRAAPVEFDGHAASQVVLRDVTERRRHDRRIRALHEATTRLVTAETISTVGAVTLDVVQDVFDDHVACLWAFDPAAGELIPITATECARRVAREAGLEPDAAPLPNWTVEMTVFDAGEPRIVADYGSRADVVTSAFESVLMHPLDRHGLLTIATTDGTHFDESALDLVGILARSVVAAMDRVGADPPPE